MGLRWVLLFIFPVGWYFTQAYYKYNPTYLISTLVATVSLGFLLLILGRSSRSVFALAIWIIVGIVVAGYFVKFYWLSGLATIDGVVTDSFDNKTLALASMPDLMLKTYWVFTIGFVAFCLSAMLALILLEVADGELLNSSLILEDRAEDSLREKVRRLVIPLLIFTAVAMIISAGAQYVLGIGVAGVQAQTTSYRLGGIIFYLRSISLPFFLLLILWLTDKFYLKKIFAVSLVLLLVHGLTQTLLTASRGALPGLFIPLVLIWILSGKFNFSRKLLTVVSLVVVLLLHPLISNYRMARIGGNASDLSGAISSSTEKASSRETDNVIKDLLMSGIGGYSARIPGTECILMVLEYGESKGLFYYLFNKRSLGDIYTQDVAGMDPEAVIGISPSLMGMFFLLAGYAGVVIGMTGWVFLWFFVCLVLQRMKMKTVVVQLAMICLLIALVTSEGDIGNLPFRLLLLAGNFLLGEFLVRKFIFRFGQQAA